MSTHLLTVPRLGAPVTDVGASAAPALPAAPRVLLLMGSLDGGGAERVALNLAPRRAQLGVDLRVGVLRRTGAFLEEADPDLIVGPRSPQRSWLGHAAAPRRIAALLDETAPDVLMTFGLGVEALTALAMTPQRRARTRWIMRADSDPDAELANLPIGAAARELAREALTRLHRRADSVVAVSEDLARAIDARAFGGERRTQLIHNPLDLERVRRLSGEPLAVAPLRPYVVAAGRLVRQKGFDLLLDAFARSRAASNLDLVILGEGPLEGALRAQAQALGVGSRVLFPGFVANPWSWFRRARLFVVSSRWEGFGNVIGEAQASGTAVLATDCNFGPRDQIDHGHTGWLCPPDDAGLLSAALDAVLSNEALRQRMAAGAQRSVQAFDADRIADRYAQLFAGIAATSPTARAA